LIEPWICIMSKAVYSRLNSKLAGYLHKIRPDLDPSNFAEAAKVFNAMSVEDMIRELHSIASGKDTGLQSKFAQLQEHIEHLDLSQWEQIESSKSWEPILQNLAEAKFNIGFKDRELADEAKMNLVWKQLMEKIRKAHFWGVDLIRTLEEKRTVAKAKGSALTYDWILFVLNDVLQATTDMCRKVKEYRYIDHCFRTMDKKGGSSGKATNHRSAGGQGNTVSNDDAKASDSTKKDKTSAQKSELCTGCGRPYHNREACRFKSHPDFNKSNVAWKDSEKGKQWALRHCKTLPFDKSLSGDLGSYVVPEAPAKKVKAS